MSHSNCESESIEIAGFRKLKQVHVAMYNYGSPRVGNGNFAILFDKKVPNAFRIVVDGDIVTGIPPKTSRYKHVGTTVVIDGSGTGSVIIDPSFVERRLQFSSKSSVAAHYLTYYRAGLSGAIRASEEIREYNIRKRAQMMTAKKNIFKFSPKVFESRKNLILNTEVSVVSGSLTAESCDVPPVPHRQISTDLLDERAGDEEYVKMMEHILAIDYSVKNKSVFQSIKSMVWQNNEKMMDNSDISISTDAVDMSSGGKIKMNHLSDLQSS